MTDVVICEPIRTPVGRQGGALASLGAVDLASTLLTELVRRTGLGLGVVDDVILVICYPSGDNPAIGRIAALDAGLGTGVPGLQIDRRCGSGLQAVLYAAAQVATGAASVVVAGGAESMSQVVHYALLRQGVRPGSVTLVDRLDRARETAGGRLHPVPGGMLETAENLRAQYGIGPEVMGIGPVPATAAALERAGLTLDEIDVIELNEAFAAQVLACLREWKVDATDERLNPNGSGISLGHPVGATGARILATMAHEMQRRGSRFGLETMCIGGGQGLAAVFEAVR
jgi:acetyl-CoA acetyltransferase